MRILLVNKFYYRRGGDCIYMLNLEQLLKTHGHEVAVFAMQYPENIPSEYSRYFPSEICFRPGMGMIEAFMRPFGTSEVRGKFGKLLDDFRPDVVHLNNIHTQLSPIVANMAHERGIRVVWTLHDYKLLCPRYDCLRNGKDICEECFADKHKVLDHKCMKNSTVASVLAYWEARKWTREKLESYTDMFVCPSLFMADKMRQGGFDVAKLKTLCNFIDVDKCRKNDYSKGDYYCFIGRLSHEKGVKTLVEAAGRLPYKLVVIGGGPLEEELKSAASSNIEFVGFKQWDEIKTLVGKARFSVIPSEWYENNPLSVIEAQCLGTPVLAARIGGIPELIDEGVTGMTFESRNADDLAEKIKLMWETSFNSRKIADDSVRKYNAEKYYEDIIRIYSGKE
ncbi:MAG: glycosyltransferase [Bacteroides sp.]|nr:glycosyltransferase [Roseburia sp.]MCM1346917.1 glycosyltransferase [Bacteroides sp.]MCM1421448.1 glycosyltransferase [Bacteroides sp.]